jgi:hypothetical protein
MTTTTTQRTPAPYRSGALIWDFHAGDLPQAAFPARGEGDWPLLDSRDSWGRQGHAGFVGMGWCRIRVQVPAGSREMDPTARVRIDAHA